MMNREIVLTVGFGGTVELEGVRYEGSACDKDLRAVAEALGTVVEVRRKPEYARVAQAAVAKQLARS